MIIYLYVCSMYVVCSPQLLAVYIFAVSFQECQAIQTRLLANIQGFALAVCWALAWRSPDIKAVSFSAQLQAHRVHFRGPFFRHGQTTAPMLQTKQHHHWQTTGHKFAEIWQSDNVWHLLIPEMALQWCLHCPTYWSPSPWAKEPMPVLTGPNGPTSEAR